MAKTNTKNTKTENKEVSKKDVAISIVTAIRQGKEAVQVRWLGDARPTDEDKAKMKACGLRFYKDPDGACWASFKVGLEDVKDLIISLGYRPTDDKIRKAEAKAKAKAEPKAKAKAKAKAESKTADTSALERLLSLDEEKLAKLLAIAELLG